MLFTGTTLEILPMTHLDGTAIQNGQVGPITKLLQKRLSKAFLLLTSLFLKVRVQKGGYGV